MVGSSMPACPSSCPRCAWHRQSSSEPRQRHNRDHSQAHVGVSRVEWPAVARPGVEAHTWRRRRPKLPPHTRPQHTPAVTTPPETPTPGRRITTQTESDHYRHRSSVDRGLAEQRAARGQLLSIPRTYPAWPTCCRQSARMLIKRTPKVTGGDQCSSTTRSRSSGPSPVTNSSVRAATAA
jgi:hypothetical protein